MEKATLHVNKIAKNAFEATLRFADNTEKSFPGEFPKKYKKLDGQTVDVEKAGEKIVKVQAGQKLLYLGFAPKSSSPKRVNSSQPVYVTSRPSEQKSSDSGPLQTRHIEQIDNPAHAPYNFVPLPEQVVEAPDEIPSFDTYHTDNRRTGWIDVMIETMTPLYIRGTVPEKDVKNGKESRDISKFFSPGGQIRIPGSSLKGMIRTLVEITSYGRFDCFNDTGLYYRGLADKSNLRREYQSHMSSYDLKRKSTQYKMSAGFLIKEGFDYYIVHPDSLFSQIRKKDAEKRIVASGQTYQHFKYYQIGSEYIVVSGPMPNKKKEWVIDPSASQEKIPLLEIDIEQYKNDANRSVPDLDLVELADKFKGTGQKVPCFYVRWQDRSGRKRISFGHTAMFRLAYQLSIAEHIPEDVRSPQYIDIPEAIFGNETTFAGRVFFEDAPVVAGQKNVTMAESIPKMLGSPKPTTFQHYLVQKRDDLRNLNHYNSPAAIRGYKMYWHKTGENWQTLEKTVCLSEKDYKEVLHKHPDARETFSTLAVHKHNRVYFVLGDISLGQLGEEAFKTLLSKDQKNAEMLTKIQTVRPGVQFEGRIRFENLSDIELGALLFSLDLPKGCYHKLGMGKPLGLGSIKIVPKLYLSDRQHRYRSLLAESTGSMAETPERADGCLEAFEGYVRTQIGETLPLWKTERLKALQHLLDYEMGKQLELRGNIGYMSITATGQNDFKNRPILPSPSSACAEAFDDTRMRIETKTFTINMILQRIQQHTLDITAGFQRTQQSWDDRRQSRFIEALLTKIPAQVMYIDRRIDDKWLVVDGRERLRALERFVLTGELRLSDPEFQTELEGKTFRDLPPVSQRRIRETRITLNLIEKQTPEDMIFTIFRRLNHPENSAVGEVQHD